MLKIKPKKVKKLEEHNFIQKKVNRNLPTARQNFESFYIDGQALRAPVECQMEAHQHFWHWTSFSSHHLFHRCLLQLQKLKKRLFFPVVFKATDLELCTEQRRTEQTNRTENGRLLLPWCLSTTLCSCSVRLPFGPEGNELQVWGATKIILIMRMNVAK